jgi:hypothetical protein
MNNSATASPTREAPIDTDTHSRRRQEASVGDSRFSGFTIDKRNRFWRVIDPTGRLVCITVYKCGAKEVVRRLTA